MTEEDQPFQGIFGATSELRVGQHFLGTRMTPLTQKDVAEATGLARQTVASVLEKFVEWQLLRSDARGRERVYVLNERAPLAYALDVMSGAIIEEISGIEVLPRWGVAQEARQWREAPVLSHDFMAGLAAWKKEAPRMTEQIAAA